MTKDETKAHDDAGLEYATRATRVLPAHSVRMLQRLHSGEKCACGKRATGTAGTAVVCGECRPYAETRQRFNRIRRNGGSNDAA